MPNGFGAWTFTSMPAGVSSRPFGRTAARTPLTMVLVLAGLLPAGAEKFRKPESRPSCPPRCAAIVQAPAAKIANIIAHVSANRPLCRTKYRCIVYFSPFLVSVDVESHDATRLVPGSSAAGRRDALGV